MDILHEIRTLCADAAFREEIVDLLERLCAIDTTPGLIWRGCAKTRAAYSRSSAPPWRTSTLRALRSC